MSHIEYMSTALAQRVYEKNGWNVLEREVGDKDSVVMFQAIESEPVSSAMVDALS